MGTARALGAAPARFLVQHQSFDAPGVAACPFPIQRLFPPAALAGSLLFWLLFICFFASKGMLGWHFALAHASVFSFRLAQLRDLSFTPASVLRLGNFIFRLKNSKS